MSKKQIKREFMTERNQTINIARQLVYPEKVINKLKCAKDSYELSCIMKSAREAM